MWNAKVLNGDYKATRNFVQNVPRVSSRQSAQNGGQGSRSISHGETRRKKNSGGGIRTPDTRIMICPRLNFTHDRLGKTCVVCLSISVEQVPFEHPRCRDTRLTKTPVGA